MGTRLTLVLITLIASLAAEQASAAVGRIAGQFAVAPTGSAQYSIPIWTPPGVHGIRPKLALVYDSHLSYGIMGPGWTLSGLSVISRCNRTYAQDGAPAAITLTATDGFCMDGNRLRGVPAGSTTTYQTEIANFSQVTASGTAGAGPSYFTVQGKDGLTYEYGNTTDSKILPSTSSATPYVWALDKVTDRAGNQMTFTYYQVGGAYVPLSIKYTAPRGSTTFPYQVNFGYSTKSANDAISTFIAGTQVQQTEQLSTITMTSSGATVREYKLTYTTSIATLRATLTSIQECGGSAGTDCLAATSVGYQSGVAGVASPGTATGSGATNGTVYSVDVDGDGRQDLVFAVASGSNYQWWVQLATATGYGTPINTGAVTVGTTGFLLDNFDAKTATEMLAPVGTTFYAYKWNGTCSPSTGGSNCFTATTTTISVVSGAQYSSADVDGDGRPDIVYLTVSPPNVSTMSVQFNTTSGSVISFNPTPISSNVSVGTRVYWALVGNNQQPYSAVKHLDFDGDGRQDLMLAFVVGPQTFAAIPVLSRGAAGFVLGTANYSVQNGSQFEAVNWNDDACTDMIVGNNLLLSGCNGSIATFITLPAAPSLAVDWDGDGRTDALANVSGTWQLIRSEGNTFAPAVSTGIAVGGGTYIVTDQNGDGLDDLVFANSSAANAIYYGLHSGTGQPPDLAISFVDGFGNFASPTYVSIATSNYVNYVDATYPYQNYIGPLYVVANATLSDPSSTMPSGTYSQGMNYSGAWKNLQGRGFQGFYAIQTSDSRYPSGMFTSRYYGRSFPYSGMQWQTIVFKSN